MSEKNDLSFGTDKIISVANMYFKEDTKESSDDYMKTYNVMRLGDIAFEGNKSKNFAHGRFVENTIGDGIVSHVFDVFRPIADYDLLFWKYIINNEGVMGRIMTRCTKASTMMTNLVADDFLKEKIAVPSLEEQRQIGSFLNGLDTLITLHQRSYNLERESKTTNTWEQREFNSVFTMLQNNTLSRAELVADNGAAMNVHYGDILVKFGEVLDLEIEALPYIESEQVVSKFKSSYLQNGDVIVADTAEDEAVGKCTEIANLSDVTVISGLHTIPLRPQPKFASGYLGYYLNSNSYHDTLIPLMQGTKVTSISKSALQGTSICYPTSYDEQQQIGTYFRNLDNLITLHQCKLKTAISRKYRRYIMLEAITKDSLFHEYYAQWIKVYKEGAIRKVTMDKYLMTHSWLKKLIPNLKICEMTRITYQQLLNDYAECHERQTTMDFHHQLKCAIIDAVDEGMITRDPTRKAIIKGKPPREKKTKYMNQFELHTLLNHLELTSEISWDWFILLVAKTGMRFSEALALTPKDFDFPHQVLSINKTWDYKGSGGFLPTKNKSSVRKIQMDWQTVIQFSGLVRGLPEDEPIFVKSEKCVYNSTVNDILERHCKAVNVPVISVHGLRHTHASLLLFAGVSIASVARRLGHASMTTTQKTYLHIIQELENKDIDLVMRSLSELS